ncbi:nuclear transport factor 2 family protein [Muricoccus radiodurans]|uniref:nuclear transport factor 2 family protein n=1 Tax=Muricoccus radiodurans TaxID=2231721 RepID=UPI003CE7E762
MDELRAAALILSCQQAVMRFYAALDRSDYEAVASGMAPDGVWHRQGKALRGPDAVSAALQDRPAGRVTAHMVQNLAVDLVGDNEATARYLTLVYRHDGAPGAQDPAPIGNALSIAAAEDRLHRVDGTWLVMERRSRRVFG